MFGHGDKEMYARTLAKVTSKEYGESRQSHLIQIDARTMLHRRASQDSEDDETLRHLDELEGLQSHEEHEYNKMIELEELSRGRYSLKFKSLMQKQGNAQASIKDTISNMPLNGQTPRTFSKKSITSKSGARSSPNSRKGNNGGKPNFFLDSFKLAQPSSLRGITWDPSEWLRARKQLIQEGRASELINLARASRATTNAVLKDRQYKIMVAGKLKTVDLSNVLVQAEAVRWLGQRTVAVPRMPATSPGTVTVEPPMIPADMTALDIAQRLRTTRALGGREVFIVAEVTRFGVDGTFGDLDNAPPALQNILIRTDLVRFLRAAEVEVRAGRSTLKDHMCAVHDPYMCLCRNVTVLRGLPEDGYPFYQEPYYINVIVCAMSSLRPGLITSTNASTGDQTVWYRADDEQTALLERLSLIGCAALQGDFKERPILILEPLGCSGRGLHPRDAVASSLKHWRQRFANFFHAVYLACGSDADLASTMDIAINARVYAAFITKDVSDFAEWHWDSDYISMHINYKDMSCIATMYMERRRRTLKQGRPVSIVEDSPGDSDAAPDLDHRGTLRKQGLFNLLEAALVDNATHGNMLDEDEEPELCQKCGRAFYGDAVICEGCASSRPAAAQAAPRRRSLENQAKALYNISSGAKSTMSSITDADTSSISGVSPPPTRSSTSTYLKLDRTSCLETSRRVSGRVSVAELVIEASKKARKESEQNDGIDEYSSEDPDTPKPTSSTNPDNTKQGRASICSRQSLGRISVANNANFTPRMSVVDARLKFNHAKRRQTQAGHAASPPSSERADEKRAWEIRQAARERLMKAPKSAPSDAKPQIMEETLTETEQEQSDDESINTSQHATSEHLSPVSKSSWQAMKLDQDVTHESEKESEWQVRRDAHALVAKFRNAADDFWSRDSASRRKVAQLRKQPDWSPHAHGEYRKRAMKKKSGANPDEVDVADVISDMQLDVLYDKPVLPCNHRTSVESVGTADGGPMCQNASLASKKNSLSSVTDQLSERKSLKASMNSKKSSITDQVSDRRSLKAVKTDGSEDDMNERTRRKLTKLRTFSAAATHHDTAEDSDDFTPIVSRKINKTKTIPNGFKLRDRIKSCDSEAASLDQSKGRLCPDRFGTSDSAASNDHA